MIRALARLFGYHNYKFFRRTETFGVEEPNADISSYSVIDHERCTDCGHPRYWNIGDSKYTYAWGKRRCGTVPRDRMYRVTMP